MKKTLNISGKDISFSCNASFAYIFKNQFGYDILVKIMPIISDVLKGFDNIENINDIKISEIGLLLENLYSLELIDIQNLIWTFAKINDKDIKEPEIWYSEFETFEIVDVAKELFPMFFNSIISKKKIEKLIQKPRIA